MWGRNPLLWDNIKFPSCHKPETYKSCNNFARKSGVTLSR